VGEIRRRKGRGAREKVGRVALAPFPSSTFSCAPRPALGLAVTFLARLFAVMARRGSGSAQSGGTFAFCSSVWYIDSRVETGYRCIILLIQKNEAKSKTGSRRSMLSKPDPPIRPAPVTPHPRRRLLAANPHTPRHPAPHHAPRVATAPHCRGPRRATSRATSPDTASQGTPQHTPPRRTPQARGRHSPRHSSRHRKPGVAIAPFCLWITCGKPVDNSPPPLGDFHTSTSSPHFVHKLSTSYPQVIHRFSTSHAVRGY